MILTDLFFILQINDTNSEFAERVKARIEKTTLAQVTEYVEENYLPHDCFLLLKLDIDRIKMLKLEIDINSVCHT